MTEPDGRVAPPRTDSGPGVCDGTTCGANERCTASGGVATCVCAPGYTEEGGECVPITDPCVAAGTCPDGEWRAVSLPGHTPDEQLERIMVDPVRPSDFYVFTWSGDEGPTKVYVSTDYGATWEQRNTTAELRGRPWGPSIDPNPDRDPSTPPTMWSPAGSTGPLGAWKSIDGGVTWERSTGADAAFAPVNPFGATATDVYQIQILPDDPPNHVLATYHYNWAGGGPGGLGETWDGGETWVLHYPPEGFGTSHYIIPISGTTWGIISQDGTGGTWRTTTAGRVGGTAANQYRDGTISPAAWQRVADFGHAHGSHQNVVLPDGRIFMTVHVNGAMSTDEGATWTTLTDGNWSPGRGVRMTNLMVTDRFIYVNAFDSPDIARAPLDMPVGSSQWELAYAPLPGGYEVGGGPFGSASSYNPATGRWVLLAGSVRGVPLMKYVEPPE